MHSYIKIHHFEPPTSYQAIEKLAPFIERTMQEQQVRQKLGTTAAETLHRNLLRALEIYYRLTGIDEEVIASEGRIRPNGILPRFTESLIGYFQKLDDTLPASEEIATLKYSGVNTIKIRYKYTDSVIKKLIKLGIRNPASLEDPLRLFLKNGALHDLIGILFICSYPYEKEWTTRTLYNFFEYDHRTDDHLLYGFYTVKKESGYRALHCDHTIFNPRFDAAIPNDSDHPDIDTESFFARFDPEESSTEILTKFKNYFNIEIQIHTTFENLWASMEHTSSYNIQAKGAGRSSKITVQWKLLSDAMQNLEEQFEQLQVQTEQARFEVLHHSGYLPVKNFLEKIGSDAHSVYETSRSKIEELENLLTSHEISRQEYVHQLQQEIEFIDSFCQKQSDPAVQTIFMIHSAFIYYGLANQSDYFNDYDIRQFVKKSMGRYSGVSSFLISNPQIYMRNAINIVAIFRYLYLAHKYGMGLINPPREIFTDSDTPAALYGDTLLFFKRGVDLLNNLGEYDISYFFRDGASSIKIINHYDILAREWELFNRENNSEKCEVITDSIVQFREKYITLSLLEQFDTLLESNEIKNIGFVVKFYTTLVWHRLLKPISALKQIIKYSAYDKIKANDLFYYELSAYRSVLIDGQQRRDDSVRIEHLKEYHRKNMIQLLFRIQRNASGYQFHKARLYFENLTGSSFKLDHFSDSIERGEMV